MLIRHVPEGKAFLYVVERMFVPIVEATPYHATPHCDIEDIESLLANPAQYAAIPPHQKGKKT